MAGTYTALPAASTAPDVPSGWNPLWPFPGVLPPGYAMTLSLNLSAPATTFPGQEVSDITLGLFDQVTYPTTEPDSGMIWSATFKDNSATVRINDGSGYADTVPQDYSEIDPQWGSAPTFTFEVTVMDVGREITLNCISDPFGDGDIDASEDLTVIAEPDPVIRIEMYGTVTGNFVGGESDYWYFSGSTFLYRGSSNRAWVNNNFSAGSGGAGVGWNSSVIQELAGGASSSTVSESNWTIDVAAAAQTFYTIKHKMSSGAANPGNDPVINGDEVTFTLEGTVKTYVNEVLFDTETFEKVDIDLGIGTILSLGSINGNTGSITIY